MDNTIAADVFLTVGQIAERLGVPLHRVKYAISTSGIKPAMRVGILRVWRECDIPLIQTAVNEIAVNRPKGDDQDEVQQEV